MECPMCKKMCLNERGRRLILWLEKSLCAAFLLNMSRKKTKLVTKGLLGSRLMGLLMKIDFAQSIFCCSNDLAPVLVNNCREKNCFVSFV
mmetsp:Transcript_8125/g.16391  ORF Transcript_8125/g.16391 Transcript_8125/m.16391 type:complete len:90 (+) Transcript_8125:1305-1574(+)